MKSINAILRTPSALVILIASIVTLIGVIIRSEYDKNIAAIPINATTTAEARQTEFASFATLTQLANVPISVATIFPVNIDTPTLTLTSAIMPSLTLQPTNIPSQTPTETLTFTPTVEPKTLRGIDRNCIDKKYWYPKPIYSSDKITVDVNNCWNLSSWGIVAENQALKISFQDKDINERITRSIYTLINSKVKSIRFKVKVDTLTSAVDMDGVLFIGLGNEGNFSKSGLFVKINTIAGFNKTFLETSPEYNTYWVPRTDYNLGDELSVSIVINGDYVSIRLNGNEVRGINLNTNSREVLWIGYNSPATNNNLTAYIFDFAISENK